MKTIVRIASGLLAVACVAVSTNCSSEPTEVYHYRTIIHERPAPRPAKYDGYYYGGGTYTPPSYGNPEGFEPVERF